MAGRSRKRQDTKNAAKSGTSRKGAASGKGTASAKAGAAKSAGRRGTDKDVSNSFMGTEVAIIAIFAISVLLFLSNFGLCGSVGNFFRGVLLGIFGTIGYIAPVLLFVGTCFYLSNRGNMRAVIKMAAVGAVLLALCGLVQLMFGGGLRQGWKLTQYYVNSSANGSGGGFLGGVLVTLLGGALGTVGAYLVLLVLLAIGLVCITERSLVNFVKSGSGRAYEYAREDMSRRRELYEERKEEKRRLREEQRVRGVDLGAVNLTEVPLMREFASGIPEGTVLRGDEPERTAQDSLNEKAEKEAISDAESLQPERNPADYFQGSICMNGVSRPEGRSDESEDHGKNQAAVSGDTVQKVEVKTEKKASLYGLAENGPEDSDSDRLLKQLYIQRDTRTVEEMSQGEEAVPKGPGYTSVRKEAEETIVEDDPESWEETPFDEDEIEPVEGYRRTVGEKTDDFFVPEKTKTVVTSSGKIIETDTELVRKTLEKKIQERKPEEKKNQPEKDNTAGQQIRQNLNQAAEAKKEYVFPPLTLLKKGAGTVQFSDREYRETAVKLQQTLQNFGVGVTVTNISCGPSVTRYELHPEQGVKVSKIVALADDIKLNLAAADIRIEAPIPGKAAVGIEVPNKENNVVHLRELLESPEFRRHPSRVAFAVGKDIAGQTVVSDIAKMPHLLIAGATGSGKSVCINTLIMSVIYKAKPDEVKLIMIDPKVVELSVYNGIPHLLIPVVTDPKKASGALNWAVAEMTDRYQRFAKYNVRDLKGYNAKVDSIESIEDENKPEKLPQIIIIVDELADLMMVAPGEVEDAICRLAQLARAAGIHLVIATQRPSVNVITGVIKANIPSRIAFSVSSGVDSRTIIDMNGAEKLLGKGDMLFYPSGYQKPQRVQGAFVSDNEVSAVVDFLTEQGMTASYSTEVESKISASSVSEGGPGGGERDAYFIQAGRFIIEKDKASIGMLQRMFKIGFNRAARIMDQLADAGIVGEEEGTKPRKVLMSMEQFENEYGSHSEP